MQDYIEYQNTFQKDLDEEFNEEAQERIKQPILARRERRLKELV